MSSIQCMGIKHKQVPGFEDYFVSMCGSVVSMKGRKPRKLKQHKNQTGYIRVYFSCDGHDTPHSVHRLVWETWRVPIADGKQINHKDGDKSNNHLSNLEVVTPSENMTHSYRTGLRTSAAPQGEDSGNSKLTAAQVYEIRRRCAEGVPQTSVAKMFGLTQSNVSRIVNRKTWQHLPECGGAV